MDFHFINFREIGILKKIQSFFSFFPILQVVRPPLTLDEINNNTMMNTSVVVEVLHAVDEAGAILIVNRIVDLVAVQKKLHQTYDNFQRISILWEIRTNSVEDTLMKNSPGINFCLF